MDPQRQEAFRHEALLYAGQREFLARTSSFIRDALTAGEPILVVVSAAKIDLLRSGLGGEADLVLFADMAEVGRNPARIIPAWRQFVTEHAVEGRRLRGIGEPIWPGRSPAELVECHRHEALLNLAFAGSRDWWLLCPYDTEALDAAVVDEARRRHPFLLRGRSHQQSANYRDNGMATAPFGDPLPEPPGRPLELAFGAGPLDALRKFVSRHAAGAGLGVTRTDDLVLAVNEVATNSLRHGGGGGILRMWQNGDPVICEISDQGYVDQPLVGREYPTTDKDSGRGLWLANGLCDLVQLQSTRTGTIVRLHMRRSEG